MKMKHFFFTGLILVAGLTACNDKAKPLSWDFTNQENYTYSYLKNEETITVGPNFTSVYLYKTTGDMAIQTKENNTANIVLNNGRKVTYIPDGDIILDSFQAATEWKIDKMNPDGSLGNHMMNYLLPLELLLRLPATMPDKGKETEQPTKLTVYDGKEQFVMDGAATYTYAGNQEVNGYNCAEIKGNLTFNYKNTDGNKIKINTTAEITYYFALDKHCLVQGSINFSQKVIPSPEDKKTSLYWANTKEETTNVKLTVELKEE